MRDLSPDAWAVVGLTVTTVGTTLGAYLKTRSEIRGARRHAEAAETAANEARDNAAPVSNGYTAHTLAILQRIERRQDEHGRALAEITSALMDHLQDHSRSHIGRR